MKYSKKRQDEKLKLEQNRQNKIAWNKRRDDMDKEAALRYLNVRRDYAMLKAYLRKFDISYLQSLWQSTYGVSDPILAVKSVMPQTKRKLVLELFWLLEKHIRVSMNDIHRYNLMFPELTIQSFPEKRNYKYANHYFIG